MKFSSHMANKFQGAMLYLKTTQWNMKSKQWFL